MQVRKGTTARAEINRPLTPTTHFPNSQKFYLEGFPLDVQALKFQLSLRADASVAYLIPMRGKTQEGKDKRCEIPIQKPVTFVT